jgi:CubicO group peptidase (beta-lactamase class C family)
MGIRSRGFGEKICARQTCRYEGQTAAHGQITERKPSVTHLRFSFPSRKGGRAGWGRRGLNFRRGERVNSGTPEAGRDPETIPPRVHPMRTFPLKLKIELLLSFAVAAQTVAAGAQKIPGSDAIDQRVRAIMSSTHANGMAIAVIDHGKVGYVHAYGIRNAKGDPLNTDTIMYGASLTKAVFAYTVMQLVDQGKIALDTPVKEDLDKPLPEYGPDPVFPDKYGPYKDLAGDPRWQRITPRMCLTHSTGFSNFWFIEPDQKLHIHFEPGTQFSYSGEGFGLLQFVVEHGRAAQGLGLDVADLTAADFRNLGMTRTSLVFLNGADTNVADGWDDKGHPQEHSQRKKVRVAGSMNTTIGDFAKFAAAVVRGDGLSAPRVRR